MGNIRDNLANVTLAINFYKFHILQILYRPVIVIKISKIILLLETNNISYNLGNSYIVFYRPTCNYRRHDKTAFETTI